MGIRFYVNNWLTSASAVGLLHALEKEGYEAKSFIKDGHIELDEKIFQNIGRIYTNYLLKDLTPDSLQKLYNSYPKKNKDKSKTFNVYNAIVLPVLGDFFTNSIITNPSLTKDMILLQQDIENVDKVCKESQRIIQGFIQTKFEELLKYKRSNRACFFCGERKAYVNKDNAVKIFDSTNFTPLSASLNTVENFFYNGRTNLYLCPECEIFLYYSAFGFTKYSGGNYLFVYTPDLEETKRYNYILQYEVNKDLRRAIIEASKSVEERKAKWLLENIYIVEIETVGNSRAYIYSLHIDSRLAKAIKELIDSYPNFLDRLFGVFLDYVYSGRSLYEFLYKLISGFYHKASFKNATNGRDGEIYKAGKSLNYLPRNLIFFIKFQEVLDMQERAEKQVNWAYGEGLSLRRAIKESLGEDRGSKKIEILSYRLLEAIRRSDENAFAQNIIRAYLEVEREIPYIFVEALKERNFSKIGYSFLIGLNGKDKEEQEKSQEE